MTLTRTVASPEEAYVQVELEHLKPAIDRVLVMDWPDPEARARFAADLRRIATDIEELS